MTINEQSRIALSPNLVLRVEADDYALLFNPDSASVQILNETAVEVCQRLDGRTSLHEILDALRKLFDGVDPEAERQVLALVQTLVDKGDAGVIETS